LNQVFGEVDVFGVPVSIFKHEKEPHSLFLRWKPTEDAKTMLTEENMRLAISERTKGFTFEPAILKVSPRLAESTPDLTQSYSPGATLFQFSVPVFSQDCPMQRSPRGGLRVRGPSSVFQSGVARLRKSGASYVDAA